MAPQKLQAGSEMPKILLPKVGGGKLAIGGSKGWEMLVMYRGKYCPIRRSYLKTLDGLLDQFKEAGTEVVAASANTKEKAKTEAKDESRRFPVGYDLSQEQMRTLGLYISEPRSPQETDRPFPEPGLFVRLANAPAIRSWPQSRFSSAMQTISCSRSLSTRGLPAVRRAFEPSNLRATSLRYHARMVSGRATFATSPRTLRPSR